MGRPGLSRHPKFRRLASDLGSRPLARGVLETMWETVYETGDPYLGDERSVELAAEWDGEPGILLRALLGAGGNGSAGFIDEIEEGRYAIHDLWDHAPDYVRKRRKREMERKDTGRRLADSDRSVTGHSPPNGSTPAPAPAPAPAPLSKKTVRSPQPSALGFAAWWEVWPNRKAKEDAEKAWFSLSDKERSTMVDLTKDYLARRGASESAGVFVPNIPLPATYLRKKRWTDQFDTTPQGRSKSKMQPRKNSTNLSGYDDKIEEA